MEFEFGRIYPIRHAPRKSPGSPFSGPRIMVCIPKTNHTECIWTIAHWDGDEHAANPEPYWSMEYFSGMRIDSRNNQPAYCMPLPPVIEIAVSGDGT